MTCILLLALAFLEPPPIRIDASPKVATVGDRIRIELEIALPAGYSARVLKPADFGDFAVLDFSQGPIDAKRYGARIISAVYKTGSFEFPPLPIELESAGGERVTASSPGAKIEIRSVLSGDNRELADLKGQAELPGAQSRPWPAICAALALAAAGIAAAVLRRRRPRAAAPKDVLESIESELGALMGRGCEKGREKQFYSSLSAIVRRILEHGYGIRARGRTTAEIIGSLDRLRADEPERIRGLLGRCDMVQFAKYVPSEPEHRAAAEEAAAVARGVRKGV